MNSFARYPKDFSPIGDAMSFSTESQPSIVPGVSSLDSRKGPAAITGFVVPVMVDPVNRMLLCRWLSHIQQEVLKFMPRGTDANPPAAIVRKVRLRRRVTPTKDALPYSIDSCLCHAVRPAMALASTTASLTPAKVFLCDDNRLAAITSASPVSNSVSRCTAASSVSGQCFCEDDQNAISLSMKGRKGLSTSLWSLYDGLRHLDFPLIGLFRAVVPATNRAAACFISTSHRMVNRQSH